MKVPTHNRFITFWLGFMCVLVIAMILVGGATRLTNSGLSITEWKPISGALPPLSHQAWQSEFEKYKMIPEFTLEHPMMGLEEFKFIYFWEWGHRQLGRFIGIVFAVPFLFMLIRRRLPKGRVLAFTAILIGIGIQGAIGWWMVASGLESGMVDVAPYRLAIHLGAAFLLLAGLVWMFLDSVASWQRSVRGKVTLAATILACVTYIQIIAGAFMAGTHAGDTYKEWPLMDGEFVPEGYFILSPPLRNLTENITAIQFNHRILAYTVLILSIWFFISAWKKGSVRLKWLSMVTFLCIMAQLGLGVATLLSMNPHSLALAHQTLASLLFILTIACIWTSRERAGDQITVIGASDS